MINVVQHPVLLLAMTVLGMNPGTPSSERYDGVWQRTLDYFASLDPIPDEGDIEIDELVIPAWGEEFRSVPCDTPPNRNPALRLFSAPSGREFVLDYSEREIPPTEGYQRHLAALLTLRLTGIVPRLLAAEPDPRLAVFEHIGSDTLASVRLRLPIAKIAQLGARLVEMARIVHSFGIVHGDLNPSAVIYDWANMVDSVRFTGFHKSAPFLDGTNHIPERAIEGLSARQLTKRRRASLYGEAAQRTRRDDIANIAEMLLNLLCGNSDVFPDAYTAANVDPDMLKALRTDRATNLRLAFPDLPVAFLDFYQYCIQLSFAEKPDYDAWIGALLEVAADEASQAPLGDRSAIDLTNVKLKLAPGYRLYTTLVTSHDEAAKELLLQSRANLAVSFPDAFYGKRTTLADYWSIEQRTATELARILQDVIRLVKGVHELGLVHNGLSTDSVVFVEHEGLPGQEGVWKLDQFDKSQLYVDEKNFRHRRESFAPCLADVDPNDLSLFELRDGLVPTRRDDAIAIATIGLDLLMGASRRETRDDVVAYKINRHHLARTRAERIIASLYYHASTLGFYDRPDYESAITQLDRV